jgi:hypothetical protein
MQSSCTSSLTAFKMPAVRWGTSPLTALQKVRTVKVDTLALALALELACLLPVKYPRYHGCSAVRYPLRASLEPASSQVNSRGFKIHRDPILSGSFGCPILELFLLLFSSPLTFSPPPYSLPSGIAFAIRCVEFCLLRSKAIGKLQRLLLDLTSD